MGWRVVLGLLLMIGGTLAALVIAIGSHLSYNPDTTARIWPAIVVAILGAGVLLWAVMGR